VSKLHCVSAFPCTVCNDYVLYLSASEKIHSCVGIKSAEQHVMNKNNLAVCHWIWRVPMPSNTWPEVHLHEQSTSRVTKAATMLVNRYRPILYLQYLLLFADLMLNSFTGMLRFKNVILLLLHM